MSTVASAPRAPQLPPDVRPTGHVYARRRPEQTSLYAVVRDNLRTLYAAVEDGFAGAPLPDFVRKDLEGYLDCGLLCRGFAVFSCPGCPGERHLVAFSCKSRAFCPSCLGRRMAETAADLVEDVLPRAPLRQFVLTLPHPLRARLGYDGKLLGAVCRVFSDSVLGWYRERLHKQGQGGAVLALQRTSADLKLNPHVHGIFIDGVFVPDADGRPVFRQLPRLRTAEVADLMQIIRARVLRFLQRRGVIDVSEEGMVLPDELAQREPAFAQLAAAAVSGLPPAGPELRRRPVVIPLPGRPTVQIDAPLSVSSFGFSLHAATTAGAEDDRARQALCKYVLRPPIANEHVLLLPDDLVRIMLKRPFRDGTVAVDMDPLSLLCRLAAAVPPPGQHQIRYAGVLAAAAKWRPLVLPPPPEDTNSSGAPPPV
ncbi:MAG TPA: transposase, partial [Anaeromyxobacteraceae bacterium]